MKGQFPGLPHPQGLYDPTLERDACGVGFVVNIDGSKSHKVSQRYLLNVNFLNKNLGFLLFIMFIQSMKSSVHWSKMSHYGFYYINHFPQINDFLKLKIYKIIEKTTVSIQCVFEWIDNMHIVYRLLYIW